LAKALRCPSRNVFETRNLPCFANVYSVEPLDPFKMRVAICIATFRRTGLLQKALEGVSCLKFSKVAAPEVEVIVVDNDPSLSASFVCKRTVLSRPVRYVAECRRGIVHVRNRAIAEASGSEFLAFLDDDEVPCEMWLDELLATQARFGADVVAGPTRPVHDPGLPEWIRRGSFFERPRHDTGTPLAFCASGNVLVRAKVFPRVGRFDDNFQLTGGEDTQFFLRVRRAGYKIVWSNEAVAWETVPRDRATLSWIVRRGYQCGNSWSLAEMSIETGLKFRALRFCKGSTHIVAGMAGAVISLFLGRIAFAKNLRRAFLGAGMLAGLAGKKYLAYQSSGSTAANSSPDLGGHSSAQSHNSTKQEKQYLLESS
jgi:succinoglycan biosynthesis protein ExoM